MNVEQLKTSGWIIFESLVGSRAYHTHNDNSDYDYRGIFSLPLKNRISVYQKLSEIGSEKPIDIKYYELEKFIELAKDCNPNIIELLFMPKDCINVCTTEMQKIIENRHIFISTKAYHTFSGYAFAQIKKAKGTNKWINNPKSESPPIKEDFCWVIPKESMFPKESIFDRVANPLMPCRPISINDYRKKYESDFTLKDFHVSSLEHMGGNTYRMYRYNKQSKGVFRNENLVCESIPIEDEKNKFWGILIYNENEYNKAKLDWKNYWTWVKERNPHRWVSQEKGEVDHDVKNMQHCMRLLMSGESILMNGEPIIRFEGEQLEFLKNIRKGHFSYEYLIEKVEEKMEQLKSIYESSKLPRSVNKNQIDNLYKEIVFEK